MRDAERSAGGRRGRLVVVRTGRLRLLLALAAAAGLALLFASSSSAVHDAGCTSATTSGCLFELDGNVQNDVAAAGNNAGYDWADGPGGPGVFTAAGTRNPLLADPQLLNATFEADYATPDNSYFAQSAKDIDDVSSWKCGSVNNPTPKDEILNAYAALFSPAAGTDAGHLILYVGSERGSNNGDSFMGFWLFKSGVSCNSPSGAATPFSGAHEVGDILVLSNFTGGGSNPLVQVYRWNPATLQATNPLELLTEGGFCSAAQAGDAACGANNAALVQTPWAPSNSAATALQTNEFLEVGIDLTSLLDLSSNSVPCFARFQAETRTSQQTTAELKDFTSGDLNTCSSTTVTTPKDASGTALNDSTPVPSSTVVHDDAVVTGSSLVGSAPNPTGTVSFFLCGPIASGTCDTGGIDEGTATLSGSDNPATASSNSVSGLAAGRYCFRAAYTDTGSPPNYGQGSSDNSSSECFLIGQPAIHVTKTADASTVNAGDPIGFTVGVSNTGSATATGVTVNDPLPAGLTWSIDGQSNAGLCSIASDTLSCGPATLASGGSFSVHITAQTSAAACGTHDNTASVTTSNDGSDQASASVTVQCPPPVVVTPPPVVVTHPAIGITKLPATQTVTTGSTATFTIAVTNTGDVTLTNVTVTDALSPGCARTKADIAGLASMAPGATLTYTCTSPAVTASFTNVAVATGTPPSGPNVTASASAAVVAQAPLKPVVKKKPKVVSHKKPKATG